MQEVVGSIPAETTNFIIMANYQNSISKMIMNSDTVYLDGKTVKDRHANPELDYFDISYMDNCVITYFNRDINEGPRVLKLVSKWM